MKTITIILLLLSLGCQSVDLAYVKDRWWTHDSGVRLGQGDFLIFDRDGPYQLRHDTIFKNSLPRAIIERLDKKKNLIYMRTLPSDSVSVYYHHDYGIKGN